MGVSDKHLPESEVAVVDSSDGHVGTHHVALERNFSFISCLGMAFAMLNSWTGAYVSRISKPLHSSTDARFLSAFYRAAALQVVLPSGGSVTMIWGLVVSTIGTLAMALSLAEACHVFPTTGGQYDWTYFLAPQKHKNSLSYFAGWMAVAGWISLVATGSSLGANFITGIINLWHPTFTAQRYQTFLIYLAFTIGAFCLKAFAVRLLPLVDRAAFYWSLSGIVVVIITLLATSSHEYQPGSFVFGNFINETGWPNGMAFILGLLQSTFGLTGFDAISHMIEEMPSPSKNAPRVMIIAVLLGSSTSWIYMVVLLFCLTDVDTVISAGTGPLLQIYYQATNSLAGATCLIMFNLLAMAFATQGLMTVASRITLSFARDRGFGRYSYLLEPVHPGLKVPLNSLIFTAVWVIIFGLIYLGSSVALNAILSASVVFVQISYIVPISLLFIYGDKMFEGQPRVYSLGKFRRLINGFALIFAFVTSVCFILPPFIPVETGSAMNYVIVVWAVVMVLWAVNWFFDGRKHFDGPSNLIERLKQGQASH